MVDVSGKDATERMAVAEGRVVMQAKTLDIVLNGNAVKGDVLGAARIAGIMAAKRTPPAHPALPSAAAHQGRGRHRAGSRAAGLRGAGDRQGHRPDRRRDGGADRGVGRVPDDLRHGQGGREAACGSRASGCSKSRAASPATTGPKRAEAHGVALLSVADALARVLDGVAAAAARGRAADRRRRPGAGRGRRGAAHPAAGRSLGDGRLCGARGRRREACRRRSRSSARSRPAIRSRARSARARPRASSPAAWCRPAPTPS